MTPRYVTRNLVGAAAMLAFGASLAFAQVTKPRSEKQIPISKDTKPMAGHVDTVTQTVYKTDTLRVTTPGHVDTVRVAGPTMTTVVHDTVMAQPMMAAARFPRGVYFGLAGGVSAPNRAIFNPNSAGPAGQAQLGWQTMPLGIRLDANYTVPGEDSQYADFQADPSILNLSADLKLELPIFRSLTGSRVHFGLYALGGGTYVSYKDLPIRLNPGVPGGIGPINVAPGSNDWQHHAAWNYGAGASLKWSNKELFFETRIIDFNTDNTPTIRQIPFMLGFNLFGSSR
jgi:hypothetical protein